jgi:protein-L-isoaspartate(D-aspartate) O-methyltransferase
LNKPVIILNEEKYIKELKKLKLKKNILDAFSDIDRRKFFDPVFENKLYSMEKVPIGHGETSDEPVILAKMIQALNPEKNWRLLEIGTGSGYSTAILSRLVSEIVSVEYFEDLASSAKPKVISEGCYNVKFLSGDANDMPEDENGFNGIIVFAGCSQRPFTLLNILKDNGRIVFPMGPAIQQQVVLFTKPSGDILDNSTSSFKFLDFCNFSSIRGKYGWVDKVFLPVDEDSN